jgi:CheY-like chemotaxis protein
MTTGKRALIVDDSRSARVILSRMLEQHGMAVDTAESAEQALEYLHQNRPDVIFMDHLMPGMDGFQAVQAIKSDAQMATIPLMMYTSQEGELYVSQARALGAIGVLPKTVRPVDVSRVLYQLRLLPDRRQSRSALFERPVAATGTFPALQPAFDLGAAEPAAPRIVDQPVEAAASAGATSGIWAAPPIAISELQASLRQSVQQLVKDQLAEQRRFLLATFEAFARRLVTEMKESAPKPSAAPVVDTLPIEPAARPWWAVLLTGLLAVVPAVVLGALYWQTLQENRQVTGQLGQLQAEVGRLGKAVADLPPPVAYVSPAAAAAAGVTLAPSASGAGTATVAPPASAAPEIEYVPYGEAPFADGRLDKLRSLAVPLESQKFSGRILVESYVGDFCLTGDPAEGFSVADPAVPFQKCELVGNPFDDSLSPAQRQSVDFANFIASLRKRTGGAIVVETVNAGRRNPVEYPEQAEGSTAGAWNTIAAQNNRVEFRVVPAE